MKNSINKMAIKTSYRKLIQLSFFTFFAAACLFLWQTSAQMQDVNSRSSGTSKENLVSDSPLTGLTVSNLNALTATDLVQRLIGNNTPFSNVQYTGGNAASGSFTGGTGIIGFDSGIVLTTGSIHNVVGPNIADNITTSNGLFGDASLESITPHTMDASVLEFDFVPTQSTVTFQYVFTSDEYNEFANTAFNDVFAFFLNGVNVALLTDGVTPVSINRVNGGNPYGTNAQNSTLYINNDLSDGGGSINTEMDGLTVVLNVNATVMPNVNNHIKLAIADVGDRLLDSAVFIKDRSFIVTPPAGEFVLSSADYSLNEGNAGTSTQTVTVNRIGGNTGAITVDYATTFGTATGGAICGAGIDFVNSSGTLAFADNQISATFDVTICGDTAIEPDETLFVNLSNPTGGATIGTPSGAKLTIMNDDFASPTNTPTPLPTGLQTRFVVGDVDAVVGHQVTFWGAKWSTENHFTGGTAPASFKGFADSSSPAAPSCGGTWTATPGVSTKPPATVPQDIVVLVASNVGSSGSSISGNIVRMVVVRVDPGYGIGPGKEGTGTVVGVVCGAPTYHGGFIQNVIDACNWIMPDMIESKREMDSL